MKNWIANFNQFWRNRLGQTITGRAKRHMNLFLCTLVVINVIAIILNTSNNLFPWVYKTIYVVNFTITVIFAVEYFLSWIYSGVHPVRYVFTFASIIDIISIFPALIAYIMGLSLTHLTVFRLLRLYKFFRITNTMHLFNAVMVRSYKKLGFAFLILFVVTVIASTLVYYAENPVQPHKFSSIIETMWWVISSLTTAGYVPMNPITAWGKVLSSMIVVIGVALFAIPAGIISAGFIEEYKLQRQEYLKRLSKSKKASTNPSVQEKIIEDIRKL